MNYHLVTKYLGLMSMAVGLAMIPALICALIYGETRVEFAFGVSMVLSLVLGLGMWAFGRTGSSTMFQREAIALVGLSWFIVGALGALPYIISGALPNIVDAYFESTSGFTTTGSTVLHDIEAAPKSILFWRSFSQWLGGIGIVVLFIAVLPLLGAGGKQLLVLELPGPDHPSIRNRIQDSAKQLLWLYLGLSAALFLALAAAGLNVYDALCQMFSTVSTAGFSPQQDSVAGFDSVLVETIVIVFMLISAINFTLYFCLLRGDWRTLWKDSETRLFAVILIGATAFITLNLTGWGVGENVAFAQTGAAHPPTTYAFPEAVRRATFQVAAIGTTTGFVTDDFDRWPDASRMVLVMLMLMGGCGGSTAGGFKVVRVILLAKIAYWKVESLFRPHTIRRVRMNDVVVEDQVLLRLGGFFLLYLLCLAAATLVMASYDLPLETAASAAISSLNNIGPGLEMIGAAQDFAFLPNTAKLFLTFCMVVGRLELFTICALLLPSFWRSAWTT